MGNNAAVQRPAGHMGVGGWCVRRDKPLPVSRLVCNCLSWRLTAVLLVLDERAPGNGGSWVGGGGSGGGGGGFS